MLAVQDVSSGLAAPAAMLASTPNDFLVVMDSYPSRTISPNHLCLLQISFVMVFYHSIRKATDKNKKLWVNHIFKKKGNCKFHQGVFLKSWQGVWSDHPEQLWSHLTSLQETVYMVQLDTLGVQMLQSSLTCLLISPETLFVCTYYVLTFSIFFHCELIKGTHYLIRILPILKLLTSCLSQLLIGLQFVFLMASFR